MKYIFLYAIVLCTLLFAPLQAHAYIDPATTTYIIQIVSALIITLAVTAGLLFNRIKMFFLNIRVKLTEWRVNIGKTGQKPSGVQSKRSFSTRYKATVPINKWNFLWEDDRKFTERLSLAFLVMFAFAFTFFIFGVLELYIININNFTFRITEILKYIVGFAFVFILGGTVVLSTFKGRVFDLLLSVAFGLLLAGYIQGNVFSRSLGELTGDQILWTSIPFKPITNAGYWVGIIVLVLVIRYFKRNVWKQMVRAVSALLVIMQLVGLLSLSKQLNKINQIDMNQYLSTKGIYDVAQQDNTIVIVLDRLDNRYIENVLKENPHFFDPLDGFTRFTNNTTNYTQTFPSVANYLTGRKYFFEKPRDEFLTDAYKTSSQLPALKEAGIDVSMYGEAKYVYQNASDLSHFASNVIVGEMQLKKSYTTYKMMLLSLYRYVPLALKPFYWSSPAQFNDIFQELSIPQYVTDDISFYNDLVMEGLSFSANKKGFKYIHLNGPHAPYNMNENAEPVLATQSNEFIQTKGSFHIVYEYLNQLKALGKYKDSTIIIMADHGARADDYYDLSQPIVAGLFVKPSGAEGVPLQNNSAPVSVENFMPTIYQACGLEYSHLGKTYFEVAEKDTTPRYVYQFLLESAEYPRRLLTYEIIGDANDIANWNKIKEEQVMH